MSFLVTFIVLALLGILNAGYLAYEHYRHKPLVCPLDHDCSVVTESKWSHVFGVRNEVLGLLFYLSLFIGAIAVVFFPQYADTLFLLFFLASLSAFLFSMFLAGIQFWVIKDYCFYCLLSAVINLLVLVNSGYLFLA